MFIVLRQLETALRAMKNYIDKIVPRKVSDLQNDAEYITENDVPTSLSEFTNDAGFITESDISTPDWTATSSEPGYIDNKPNILPGTGQMSIQTNAGHTVTGTQSASFGAQNNVSGNLAFSVGVQNNVSGGEAFAAGNNNIANHESQFVFGQFNAADPSNTESSMRGTYIEIVGNGDGTTIGGEVVRSNARTLDWEGNQWIAGNMKVGGTGYDDSNAVEVATKNDIATPDWEAAEGEDGYIDNKPDLHAGSGTNSIRNSSSTASGNYSHAEGAATTASGHQSHAEGALSTASGINSHAEGIRTIANHKSQHVFGEYNIEDPSTAAATARGNYVEIIGNGSLSTPSNARTLDWSGNEWLAGNLKVGGTGYDDVNAKTVGVIDDTAGSGDTNVTWSADKISSELANSENIKIFSGTWVDSDDPSTTPSHFEFDDSSMADADFYNLVNNDNGKTVFALYVDFPDKYQVQTIKQYFYLDGKQDNYLLFRSAALAGAQYGRCFNSFIAFSCNTYVDPYTYSWSYGVDSIDIQVDNNSIIHADVANIESNKIAFNGLAKAAGDTSQASSGNPIGTYTDIAKTKIKAMLGVTDPVSEIDDTAGTGDTDKTWSANKITSELANAGSVQDVTVNGTSVVGQDGVAEIPVASASELGAVKISEYYGIGIVATGANTGILKTVSPTDAQIKAGANQNRAVNVVNQHKATFYGLAKAAGDSTQSASSNAVGTYTDNAKSAIKAMLGVGGETQKVTVSGTAPVIVANQNTRYVCGEVVSLDFTPSAEGICDMIFTSGSTVTVLTVPNTVRFPEWFDPTALEANKTYEISVSDGVYGAVMIW